VAEDIRVSREGEEEEGMAVIIGQGISGTIKVAEGIPEDVAVDTKETEAMWTGGTRIEEGDIAVAVDADNMSRGIGTRMMAEGATTTAAVTAIAAAADSISRIGNGEEVAVNGSGDSTNRRMPGVENKKS